MSKRREREVTIVLPPAIWAALQSEVAAEGLQGAHGAKNGIILRWLSSHLRNTGKIGAAPIAVASPVAAKHTAAPEDDEPWDETAYKAD